jgi:hypothetical protein
MVLLRQRCGGEALRLAPVNPRLRGVDAGLPAVIWRGRRETVTFSLLRPTETSRGAPSLEIEAVRRVWSAAGPRFDGVIATR